MEKCLVPTVKKDERKGKKEGIGGDSSMNKKPLIFYVVLFLLGLLLVSSPSFGGYLAAAGLGLLVGGAVGTIAAIFMKPKQK